MPAARRPDPTSTTTVPDFEVLLVRGATVVLAVAGSWLVVVLLAGAVETLSAGRVRGLDRAGCPPAWRPVVLLLVSAVLAAPAGAAQGATSRPGVAEDGGWLPLPTRPVELPLPARERPVVERPAAEKQVAEKQVVVRPHDTLWAIARQQLGPTRHDAAVAAQVVRLHRTNRGVIGTEPDLIHPGQRLTLPPVTPRGVRR